MACTVRLIDPPSATPPEGIKDAESRFRREIERALGDDIADALRAFNAASESSAEDLTKDEIKLASRWSTAFDKARQAGMRDLGDAPESYFEVRAAG